MNKIINVLTDGVSPNSRAFNFPILLSKKMFSSFGYKIVFCKMGDKNIFSSEILFINSRVFSKYWKTKQFIFQFLENANKQNQQIIWFDTSDSSWSTQFEILPFVKRYLKNQIFKDKTIYLNKFHTGRCFTDYFNEIYKSGEHSSQYTIPEVHLLTKIDVSWNSCFENYNENRYSKINKIRNRLSPHLYNYINPSQNIIFNSPHKTRDNDISCRHGLSYTRPSIVDHRKHIHQLMHERDVSTEIINLELYFKELRNSKVAIGAFGLGEITLRDFEIIVCGSVLVKPEMNHISTWPNLFQENITYVSHKWDLSDLNEKVDMLLSDDQMRLEISNNAQIEYKKAFSKEGLELFVKRLIDYIEV